ncbi:MAG TPA: ABC transporter ATP-binding protein, partial [Allocoleopsis sp.]
MIKPRRPLKVKSFQRAAEAPALPTTPFQFICYFVNHFRWWYVAMVILEALHATCGIMLPYAIGEIIRGVTRTTDSSVPILEAMHQPLMLFVALSVGEVIFGRSSGLCHTILHPIHRQHVTRSLYAYLQHHSHRYLSSSFAGALAHRIGETSMGVTQTMAMLINDFMPVLIVFAVSTVLLYHAHPQLAAFVGIWAIFFVGISFWLAARCRPYALNASAARSETTGRIVDSVTNLSSSRLFARLGFERRYLNEQLRRELKEVRKSNWYSERVRWFQFISAAILKIGTLYYSLSLWSQGAIGAADFVVATSLSLLIITEARNLSRRFLDFFEHIGNVCNGVYTIVQPHEIVDHPNAIAPAISQGRIEFEWVNFSYSS